MYDLSREQKGPAAVLIRRLFEAMKMNNPRLGNRMLSKAATILNGFVEERGNNPSIRRLGATTDEESELDEIKKGFSKIEPESSSVFPAGARPKQATIITVKDELLKEESMQEPLIALNSDRDPSKMQALQEIFKYGEKNGVRSQIF